MPSFLPGLKYENIGKKAAYPSDAPTRSILRIRHSGDSNQTHRLLICMWRSITGTFSVQISCLTFSLVLCHRSLYRSQSAAVRQRISRCGSPIFSARCFCKLDVIEDKGFWDRSGQSQTILIREDLQIPGLPQLNLKKVKLNYLKISPTVL